MIAGFVGSAFAVNAGFWVLTLCACVYYAGCGLMYSPLVATVLDTLPIDQSGRGVGMNDLVMNVTASIGIAIFGGLMTTQALAGSAFTGASGSSAGYANLLLIGGIVLAAGLVVCLWIRRTVSAGETKADSHEPGPVDACPHGPARYALPARAHSSSAPLHLFTRPPEGTRPLWTPPQSPCNYWNTGTAPTP